MDNKQHYTIKLDEFGKELESLINSKGIDSYCGMPDFALKDYLINKIKELNTKRYCL